MAQPPHAIDPTVLAKRQFRLAIQNLAAPAQGQRRYVQLGWIPERIYAFLNTVADDAALSGLLELNPEQIAVAKELGAQLRRELDADPNFIPQEGSDKRDYLYSAAFVNERWDRIRATARRAFSALAGSESAFIALQAM